MNGFVKFFLALTASSPVLLIVGINQFEICKPWTSWTWTPWIWRSWTWTPWIWWVIAAPILAVLCKGLLICATKWIQKDTIEIVEFERKDQEMLTFLFIYLLPFIRSGRSTFASEWITSICLLVIICGAVAHANALHFNPVMGVFGYHFYAIKDSHGVSNLLISKEDLRRHGEEVQTVNLVSNVYLQTEDIDA